MSEQSVEPKKTTKRVKKVVPEAKSERELAEELTAKKLEAVSDVWRDAAIAKAIREVITVTWQSLNYDIGRGKAKNNQFNSGYITACREIESYLTPNEIETTEEDKINE